MSGPTAPVAEEVITSQAYVLFLKRKDFDWTRQTDGVLLDYCDPHWFQERERDLNKDSSESDNNSDNEE